MADQGERQTGGSRPIPDPTVLTTTQLLREIAHAKDLLAERLSGQERVFGERFEAAEKAIEKAEAATEKRFDSVNEFRAQLADQTASFATRESQEALMKSLTALIERNRDDIAEQRGTYVPVPAYDTTIKEWTSWRTTIDGALATHQQRIIGRDGLDDMLAPLRDKVESVRAFQFKIVGALILVTVILPMITAFAVYLLTRTAVPVNGLG
jgi:hypothetical protein